MSSILVQSMILQTMMASNRVMSLVRAIFFSRRQMCSIHSYEVVVHTQTLRI